MENKPEEKQLDWKSNTQFVIEGDYEGEPEVSFQIGNDWYTFDDFISKLAEIKDEQIALAKKEAARLIIRKAKPYYGENDDLEDHYIVDGDLLDQLTSK